MLQGLLDRLGERCRSSSFRCRRASRPRSQARGNQFKPVLGTFEERSLLSTFTVTDLGDAGAGTGLQGDLRYCINTANTNSELSNHIVFLPGLDGTIALAQGNLTIVKSLQVVGPGVDALVIDGQGASGVFNVRAASDQTVIIAALTVTGGTGSGLDENGEPIGGAVYNLEATVRLEECAFRANSAANGAAIANERGTLEVLGCTLADNFEYHVFYTNFNAPIYNRGTMTLSYTTVADNYDPIRPSRIPLAVFNLRPGNLAMDHCVFSGNEGPVANYYSTMSITDCTIVDNTYGPAVENDAHATMTITDSTIANNHFDSGVRNSGELTIRGTTISGNTANASDGGGISQLFGILRLTNSTVSGNRSERLPFGTGGGSGGGIYIQSGLIEIINSTITDNTALNGPSTAGGGGIFGAGPTVLLRDTIVAGNTSNRHGPDVDGSIQSLGHNLIGQIDDSAGWVASDLTGTTASPLDPRLGPLADNGGPTRTHALLPGSPALHSADLVYLYTDQRGSVRGFGGPDIGAFEAAPAVQLRIEGPSTVYQGLPFTLTVVALDQWGNLASAYTGTIHFLSTDLNAQLPEDTTFADDAGGRQDITVILETKGRQSILAVDVTNAAVSGTTSLEVVGFFASSDATDLSGDAVTWFDGIAWHRRRSPAVPSLIS